MGLDALHVFLFLNSREDMLYPEKTEVNRNCEGYSEERRRIVAPLEFIGKGSGADTILRREGDIDRPSLLLRDEATLPDSRRSDTCLLHPWCIRR